MRCKAVHARNSACKVVGDAMADGASSIAQGMAGTEGAKTAKLILSAPLSKPSSALSLQFYSSSYNNVSNVMLPRRIIIDAVERLQLKQQCPVDKSDTTVGSGVNNTATVFQTKCVLGFEGNPLIIT